MRRLVPRGSARMAFAAATPKDPDRAAATLFFMPSPHMDATVPHPEGVVSKPRLSVKQATGQPIVVTLLYCNASGRDDKVTSNGEAMEWLTRRRVPYRPQSSVTPCLLARH